ncbi:MULTISPECIES: glycosyltransferase [Dehalobacter]|uniref:Glycosyltransferase n=2 Tax=Dehalobacter restrictus TaxID=55583 RepID=A0A857DH17_9FIRM|nr:MULTISPECIES: glycosyltransferase [Dehalobacter]AHF09000.1 glycosyl transferase [Dehalobacter restrictus DSM 9455]MCG1024999.1 glycosyltransferase [Dehalobacter sp.]OCZ50409.1 glycosyl transferase [Dehalobacter sp. TeCB1]QGZ99525.1 glycosyltransferase [Dehalobacter restrictus]
MITISLCMIVKNEEEHLPNVLHCVKNIVDEIIVVDTGSDDKSKEIARLYQAGIYDWDWTDDFAAARNYSFGKATMDYILWLDADDILEHQEQLALLQLKHVLNPNVDVVLMKYCVNTGVIGDSMSTFYRERLVKRSKNFQWREPVHEYLDFNGEILTTDICICHAGTKFNSPRNLRIYEKMLAEGRKLNARNSYYFARELYNCGRLAEAIHYFEDLLVGSEDIMLYYLDACIRLAICYAAQNNHDKVLDSLHKSFKYDIPRAEVCCRLGYYYKSREDYKKAIFWFELATKLKKPNQTWGMVEHDCWDFIPYTELCSCYYRVGHPKEALYYNSLALETKPKDAMSLSNKAFLEGVIKGSSPVSPDALHESLNLLYPKS